MTIYQPTEFDVIWAKNVLSFIKNHGRLVYPNTELEYKVNHDEHTLILQNPEVLAEEHVCETHERTKIVFKRVGYETSEKLDS